MAPFTAVPLHTVVPQARAQKQQITSLNGKVLAMSPGSSRAMASEGVQHSSSSSSSNSQNVPKMEPFNQSRISRLMREPSLLEKAENALADKCTVLEGDDAYRCWEALFEFENLKETYQVECDVATGDERENACRPLDRFENLVRQSGGVSGLIDNIRMVAMTAKRQQEPTEVAPTAGDRAALHEDGGAQDAADESGLLPESSLTRMLRHSGLLPAWFTPRPDHESD
jgi:hypothetical protein